MQEWIKTTNIYEVNLRQYTPEGTIAAFFNHLPRLKDMGVETLWFMPITPISQMNRKGSMGSYYACSDYTSVGAEFGTFDDFKTLVYQAHQMGFKVILDWVANHTGWDHWWTVEHPDWYEKDELGNFKKASGMDDIIELDFKKPALRHAMIDAMKFWVRETDIDGFRCDLAFWVELDFWVEAKPHLEAIKPLFWLGELDPYEHADYMQVFDAAYTWTWMHKTEEFYRGRASFQDLLNILDKYHELPGIKAWFTSNHDENTWNGTEYEKYGDMAKLLAVFSCTWPGVPLLYSGQELPNDKRLQFFEKDVIQWKDEMQLLSFYKVLLHLNRTNPALATDSELQIVAVDAAQKFLVFKRLKESSEVWVVLNFSPDQKNISVRAVPQRLTDVFTGQPKSTDKSTFELSPWEFSVWVAA